MSTALRCAALLGVSLLFTLATPRVFAQVPNVPIFSLWATEVTDGAGGPNKCTSCPTQQVPVGQIAPGDVIRVELFVSGWDAQPEVGICDGDPDFGNDGTCGEGINCSGMHCSNTGINCDQIDPVCPGSFCIADQCQPFPRLSAFTATIDADSFTSAPGGALFPFRIPCQPSDCALLVAGNCPCAHFNQFTSDCTCTDSLTASCDAGTNLCGIGASGFIESVHQEYLFFGKSSLEVMAFGANGDFEFTAFLWNVSADGVVDVGTRRQLGTLLLEVSADACGSFAVSYLKDNNATFVVDSNGVALALGSYEDLIVHLSSDCTVDLDGDSVDDTVDNCPGIANTDQADCDNNDAGDACDQVCAGEIAWMTFPVDGMIDARTDEDAETGIPTGIALFDAQFACYVGIPPMGDPPGTADFMGSDTTGMGVTIMSATTSDPCFLDYAVGLANPMRPGAWTTIATTVEELYPTNLPAASTTSYTDVGFLPGDVDGSATTDTFDVEALHLALMVSAALTPASELSVDIDRSGMLTAFDLVRVIDLLNGADTTRVWNGEMLPSKPNGG